MFETLDYCNAREGYEDVAALCVSFLARERPEPSHTTAALSGDGLTSGYVYLAVLKLGSERRHKIGKAILVERRRDQLSIELPESLQLVHSITTDDAYGIEAYWHRRFKAMNTKGEWFILSRSDIEAFRRRKFM